MDSHPIPTVIAIGGHDPSGGAGVSIDAAALRFCGAYPLTFITCETVQDTVSLKDKILATPYRCLEEQFKVITADIEPKAIKLGLVGNWLQATQLFNLLTTYFAHADKLPPIIVDPVFGPTKQENPEWAIWEPENYFAAYSSYADNIMLLTPNIHELQLLVDKPITQLDEVKCACEKLIMKGFNAVLAKGGHLPSDGDEVIDVYCDQQNIVEIATPRIEGLSVHGTGCALAACITAFIARGETVLSAVEKGHEIFSSQLQLAFKPGKGRFVLPFI